MSIQDPRQRVRTNLLTYLDPSAYPAMGHIYWDDGETEAEYAVMYAKPNVPLKYLYYGNKNYDVIMCIGEPDTTATRDWKHITYRYDEVVPVTLCAIDKDGYTAQLALWQAELKLRRIVETYLYNGSLYTLRRTKPGQQYLGGFFEYTVECTINYTRSTDTIPTYPTLTYSSGGTAGTFTFPNVLTFERTPLSNNTHQTIPGRKSSVTQKLGLPDYQIKMSCDLDVSPEGLDWTRTQTSSSKTDLLKEQVFLDIYFGSQNGEEYQTLDLGFGSTIKVTLEEPYVRYEGDRRILELTMYSYNTTEPATYKALFGIGP